MKYFTDKTEIKKRNELISLMNDWRNTIKNKGKIVFFDDGKEYDAIDYFNSDGFFPGYFSAKHRVLFIAREARYFSGEDRIEYELENFDSLNATKYSYWRRILYLTYGIRHEGKVKFEELPNANDILEEMRKSNDYGFAIMNISKYSNDRDDGGNADFSLINRFLSDSELDKRNFVMEEIALLSPNIVITANLWNGGICENLINLAFPKNLFSNGIGTKNGEAYLNDFEIGDKNAKLIDLYHFSSRKSDEDYFYNPVMNFIFNHN